MRVPPPQSLRIDRRTLLRDAAERLGPRLPPGWRPGDPTDPGWQLLEQAAWMVESMSEALDRYPFAMLQQLVHLTGGSVVPARPALGVAAVEVARSGTLTTSHEEPAPATFCTRQTEDQDFVSFCPAEPSVTLRPWVGLRISRIDHGKVLDLGGSDENPQFGWAGPPAPDGAVNGEAIRFQIEADPALADELLQATCQAHEDRRREGSVGWLRLHHERQPGRPPTLVARVQVSGAFAALEGSPRPAEITGILSPLPGSTWVPPTLVSGDPALPRGVRGRPPLAGAEPGTIRVPDVPPDFPLDQLLVREPVPVPREVLRPMWDWICGLNSRLRGAPPRVLRAFGGGPQALGPSAWLGPLLNRGLVPSGVTAHVVHLRSRADERPTAGARVALVCPGSETATPSWAALGERGQIKPLSARLAWEIDVPVPSGPRARVTAWDLDDLDDARDILATVEGDLLGVIANAVLVVNAPVVRDGRQVEVTRATPLPVRLLHGDIVETLPPAASAPLALIEQEGETRVQDWCGVNLDPTQGLLCLNAPDREGVARRLRAGSLVHLRWYRRTDGNAGNVDAGDIALVETSGMRDPWIAGVTNPLPTTGGRDRESADVAMERLLSPATATPVLPADFERLIRHALGTARARWMVRCWSWAERSLVPAVWWPPDEGARPSELDRAGPEVLLVVLGPESGPLSPDELAEVRHEVDALMRGLGERLPVVQRAVVLPLHRLLVRGEAPVRLPSFVAPVDPIEDAQGRVARLPPGRLLLNAAITRAEPAAATPERTSP